MRGGASISLCGTFRYTLIRTWDEFAPRVLFVLLNPSKADAQLDDNTLRKGIKFAQRWGAGSVEYVNLFAFRATDPKELPHVVDPVGPENDVHILEAARRADTIVLAWGSDKMVKQRAEVVVKLLEGFGYVDLWCLHQNKDGQPGHPLYLRDDTELKRYEGHAQRIVKELSDRVRSRYGDGA